MSKQLSLSTQTPTKPTPLTTGPFSLKKYLVNGISQIMKNFNQGFTFLSSMAWVGGTFCIIFMIPLAAAVAIKGEGGDHADADGSPE
jgi:hypothetical protein